MGTARHKRLPLWLWSTAMAFVFVVGSASPEASHCLTACGPFGSDPCSVEREVEGVHALAGADDHDASEQGAPSGDGACAGPTCLCHQHLDTPDELLRPSCSRAVSLALRSPELPDLGVVREIVHVPRAAA